MAQKRQCFLYLLIGGLLKPRTTGFVRGALTTRLVAEGPCRKRGFPQLFLCSSQACHGKLTVFWYQNGSQTGVFRTDHDRR
jgi:hypothetical protein